MRGRRAVVGAAASVLLHPAAELRIGHDQTTLPGAGLQQRAAEGGEARREVAQQAWMLPGLPGVGVVTALLDLDHRSGGRAGDQGGGELQLPPQGCLREVDLERSRHGQPRLDPAGGDLGLTAHRENMVEGRIGVVCALAVQQARGGLQLPLVLHDKRGQRRAGQGARRRAEDNTQVAQPRRQTAGLRDRAVQPAVLQGFVAGRCGVPDLDGTEVGAVGPGIADAEDGGQVPRLPGRHQRFEGGAEAQALVELQHAVAFDGKLGPYAVIGWIAVGNHAVEPVVAAGQFEED